MEQKDLLGMTIEELKQFAVELGEAPFRGKQLFRWIHKGERDFSAMTDFSEKLREKLQEAAFIGGVQVEKIQHDKKDGTRKFLYGLKDGNAVEGVFMKYSYGNSLCVSGWGVHFARQLFTVWSAILQQAKCCLKYMKPKERPERRSTTSSSWAWENPLITTRI